MSAPLRMAPFRLGSTITMATRGGPIAPQTLQAIWERLYTNKHTGPVIVHLAQGQPNVIEIPGTPERIPVDKGNKRA